MLGPEVQLQHIHATGTHDRLVKTCREKLEKGQGFFMLLTHCHCLGYEAELGDIAVQR